MEKFTFAGLEWPAKIAVLHPNRKNYTRRKVDTGYSHAPTPLKLGGCEQNFYHDDVGMPGLRWKWCDDVERVRIDHTGWFTDDDGGGDKIRGMVFRLNHGKGFVIGWSMGSNMVGFIDYDCVYADERTAAHSADKLAERVAEKARDEEREEQAKRDEEEAAARLLLDRRDEVNEALERAGWV